MRKEGSDKIVPLDTGVPGDGVIDLAGFRMTRGKSSRSILDRCKHRNLIYDQTERRVHCEDCDRDIDAFDGLMSLGSALGDMLGAIRRMQNETREAKAHALTSRAAKAVDEVWRGRNMAPCCPHCSRGLLPEDFAGGAAGAVSREYEMARRKRDSKE